MLVARLEFMAFDQLLISLLLGCGLPIVIVLRRLFKRCLDVLIQFRLLNFRSVGLAARVGLIVSGIAFTSRRRAMDSARLRRQATVLQGYSRDVVAADNEKTIAAITSSALAALFQVPVVVMLVTKGKVASVERVGGVEPQEADFETALSLAPGTVVRAGVYPSASRFDFWSVATAVGQAVIGLAFEPGERPSAPDTLVDIVGGILTLALDRQRFLVSRNARPTS
jgi:two-component system sensor histidine kinase KdpD